MAYANANNINRGVRTKHPDYTARKNQWARCRDVVAGKDAVTLNAMNYIPKLREQTNQDYLDYVGRANFYNATARTIGGLKGMLFRKPPIKDVPPNVDILLNDVDMCGMPFDVFAQEVVEQCLEVGRVGILVDHAPAPVVDTTLTKAAAQQLGLRPNMKIYTAENIINWKFKQINNVWTLCQVVLAEEFTQPAKDASGNELEFDNVTEPRYRVLDLENDTTYRNRVFRIDEMGNDSVIETTYPLMNNKFLNFIPFVVITEDGVSFEVEEPPLLDLVDLNLSHFRTSADYEQGCHFTALPTLFIAGWEPAVPTAGGVPDKVYLGSQSAICMSDPTAKAQFVEFTGQGLQAVENNLDRKEQQMAILGARMIAGEKKQAETATTSAIHRTGENSILSAFSIAVSLGLTKVVTWFSNWTGNNTECKYELNRDFLPVAVDGPTLTAVTAIWQAGGMSDEEYFDWMQRGDLIEAEMTFDEHKLQSFQEPVAPVASAPFSDQHTPVPGQPGGTGKSKVKVNPEGA